jgi:hypothetical protein
VGQQFSDVEGVFPIGLESATGQRACGGDVGQQEAFDDRVVFVKLRTLDSTGL